MTTAVWFFRRLISLKSPIETEKENSFFPHLPLISTLTWIVLGQSPNYLTVLLPFMIIMTSENSNRWTTARPPWLEDVLCGPYLCSNSFMET